MTKADIEALTARLIKYQAIAPLFGNWKLDGDEPLGYGGYGAVYKLMDIYKKEPPTVVKAMLINNADYDLEQYSREIENLEKCRGHENIVRIEGRDKKEVPTTAGTY